MSDTASNPASNVPSENELLDAARSGDRTAIAELWRAHAPAAVRYAWALTNASDAEDVASEACTRIWAALIAGKGPTAAFRPYLFATVRNIAARRATLERTAPDPLWRDLVEPTATEAQVVAQWDAHAIHEAFGSLPDAWQQVLRDTLINDIAPCILAAEKGTTANAVAAMAARAREALRLAWIRSHITCSGTTGEHRWTLERAGRGIRGALPARDSVRFNAHLTVCESCARKVQAAALASGAHAMRRTPGSPD